MKRATEDLIRRYAKGKASKKEVEFAQIELSCSEENSVIKECLREGFMREMEAKMDKYEAPDHVLSRIHHAIRVRDSYLGKRFRAKLVRWYYTAAAILLIPLSIGIAYLVGKLHSDSYEFSDNQAAAVIVSPPGAKVRFTLPDGTIGWLNSDSKLIYSLPFRKTRDVNLSGEAYMEVAYNPASPFSVTGKDLRVKVTGTKFNFSSYPEDSYSEVVLVEGEVECYLSKQDTFYVLKPNGRLVCNNSEVSLSVMKPDMFMAWKEGMLVFRGDPMQKLVNRLERWYNIDIVVEDKELEQYSFRGVFQNNSIEEVLMFLKKTSPIGYKIIDGAKMEDGVFRRKQVIIYKS